METHSLISLNSLKHLHTRLKTIRISNIFKCEMLIKCNNRPTIVQILQASWFYAKQTPENNTWQLNLTLGVCSSSIYGHIFETAPHTMGHPICVRNYSDFRDTLSDTLLLLFTQHSGKQLLFLFIISTIIVNSCFVQEFNYFINEDLMSFY